MDFIDTHVHLGDAQFEADRDLVIARAAESGVTRLVEIADSPAEWGGAIALARARPALRCSLGLHPYYAADFSEALIEKLRASARLPEVAAVGEIGLDYVKGTAPRDIQRAAFEPLLAAAKEWGKPSVIHCRGAYEDLLPILKNIFPHPPAAGKYWGVVHCFSAGPKEAEVCRDLGFALGADGPITYPKNEELRAAFRLAGPAAAVLETDSPYLPPKSRRGKRNEPSSIPEIAAKLAEVLELPLEELARATSENAKRLFGL